MTTDLWRWVAAITLAITGLIHLVLAGAYLVGHTYLGILFVIGGVDAVFVGAWLFMDDDAVAWAMGAVVAAGMAVGFVVSRTAGLPGFHDGHWELSGIITLALEGVYLLVTAACAGLKRPG